MSRKCAGSRDIFSGGDSQPAGTRNLPGKTARGGHCRNFFTKNKETMINSCHLKKIKLTNTANWFSSKKNDLDNQGCNALPLRPRVQGGGGRCFRCCPGWSVLLDSTFGLTILLSCQAALNAELAEIRRIQTSMAQVGKLDFFKETDLIRLGIRRGAKLKNTFSLSMD